MEVYINLGKSSSIRYYDIGEDWIIISFKGNVTYEYNYSSSGLNHIENMKSLAIKGKGLNSYIKKYVKNNYSKKIR